PEDEEDEGAEDYDAGEEGAGVDEVEEEDEEGDAEGAGGDVVGEVPCVELAKSSCSV
ncbi:hypothetical protein V500_10679, partial [Pseudogymnoascus sp. VKM F-4518 (FW-2643)]